MESNYRVRCVTESSASNPVYKYVWGTAEPTACPTDGGHTLDANSIAVVATENLVYQTTPITNLTSSTTYDAGSILHSMVYNSRNYGAIRRVKVLSKMDAANTSYDVRIYDKTNATELVSANFTNITVYDLCDVGLVITPPDEEVVLEIQAKKTGGTGSDSVYISSIMFYSAKLYVCEHL